MQPDAAKPAPLMPSVIFSTEEELRMEDTLIVVIGSCFVLVGVLTGAFFSYRIFQGTTSLQWPFVIGELESTDLKEVIYRGGDASGGADEASAWVVNFKYSYTVANKKYYGSRVTYSDGINKTMRALRKLQDKYHGKSQIQVYYNPKNPNHSVLVPGLSVFNFTPLITSSLFILAGVFIQTYDFS
jgi:hypothetical protein